MLLAELSNLTKQSILLGWQEALYNFYMDLSSNGKRLPEDQRMTDWLFFTHFNKYENALVFDPGLGTLAFKLNDFFQNVDIISDCQEEIDYLNTRINQDNTSQLKTSFAPDLLEHSLLTNHYDLVSLAQTARPQQIKPFSFTKFANKAYHALTANGWFYATLENKFGFHQLLSKSIEPKRFIAQSLFQYKNDLKNIGFRNTKFFAHIPFHNGIPLFYLPLDNKAVLSFFFKNIFSIFETVSPEVKAQYKTSYTLAKLGVKIGGMIKLTHLSKHFFPAFSVLAQK